MRCRCRGNEIRLTLVRVEPGNWGIKDVVAQRQGSNGTI